MSLSVCSIRKYWRMHIFIAYVHCKRWRRRSRLLQPPGHSLIKISNFFFWNFSDIRKKITLCMWPWVPDKKIPKKSGVELRSTFFGDLFCLKKLSSGYSGAPLNLGLWLRNTSGSAQYWKCFCSKNSPKMGKNGKKRQKVPIYPSKFLFGNFFFFWIFF